VAAGQTEQAKPAKGRANSEPPHSPTRPQGGAAPKKEKPALLKEKLAKNV